MTQKPDITPFIPIYKRLYETYKQAILTQQYHPGARIDSINKLIERHDVSRETAKLVLKMLADEGLIIQKAGLGSFVANLGPRKAVWGILVPFFSAMTEKLISSLKLEADKAQRKLDHFVYYNSWEEEIRLVGTMINQRYEAVIVIPTFDETRTADFYRHLVSGGTVVTLLDHTMAGSYFTYAIQSYDLGVKRAVQYLTGRTNRNLAFLKNDVWTGRNMVQEFMEESFKEFVEQASPKRNALVLDHLVDLNPDLIKKQQIGGVFCCDDADAIRVLGRLRDWHFQVPEEFALISYGNTDLARYFTPRITSIDSHCEEMAARTADIIRKHTEGEDTSLCQFVIQPDLIERDT